MSHLSVVPSIRKEPPLSDMAGQLRALADRIEKGDLASPPRAAYVVLNIEDTVPMVFGFGEHASIHAVAGLLQHASLHVLLGAVEEG